MGFNTINDDSISSILLIDDSSVDNYINHRLLELHGERVIKIFTSANLALQHLIETKTKYKYILLDIFMPVMDGFNFIEHFNKLSLSQRQGPIVIVSISINPADKLKARRLNIKFIEKPFTAEKLYSSPDL